MTEQEMKDKFETLTNKQKSEVIRTGRMIKEAGANNFFIETGCQADDPQAQITLTGFAMMELRIISVSEFYGI
jgi:hypothetical protein